MQSTIVLLVAITNYCFAALNFNGELKVKLNSAVSVSDVLVYVPERNYHYGDGKTAYIKYAIGSTDQVKTWLANENYTYILRDPQIYHTGNYYELTDYKPWNYGPSPVIGFSVDIHDYAGLIYQDHNNICALPRNPIYSDPFLALYCYKMTPPKSTTSIPEGNGISIAGIIAASLLPLIGLCLIIAVTVVCCKHHKQKRQRQQRRAQRNAAASRYEVPNIPTAGNVNTSYAQSPMVTINHSTHQAIFTTNISTDMPPTYHEVVSNEAKLQRLPSYDEVTKESSAHGISMTTDNNSQELKLAATEV